MKINKLKLKDNITLREKALVVEYVSRAQFTTTESGMLFTPYVQEYAEVGAFVRYFMEGYELEGEEKDTEIYEAVMSDEQHRLDYNDALTQGPLVLSIRRYISEKCKFEQERVISFEQNATLLSVADKLNDLTEKETVRTSQEIEAIKTVEEMAKKVDVYTQYMNEVNALLTPTQQAKIAKKWANSGDLDVNNIIDLTLEKMKREEGAKETTEESLE